MKKTIALVLCGLLLAGCGSASQPETAPAETSGTVSMLEPPETVTPIAPMPTPVILQYHREEKKILDPESGIEYLTVSSQMPTFYLPGSPQVSEKINGAMEAALDGFRQGKPLEPGGTGTAVWEDLARQRYADDPDGFVPGTVSLRGTLRQISRRLVSLTLEETSHQGGPYGTSAVRTELYDLETGERLGLEDLSAEPGALERVLTAAILEQARTDPEIQTQIAWYGPEKYEQVLPALLREGSWEMTPEGITVFSQEEELGPHGAGVVRFSVDFTRLESLVKEEFLPGQAPAPEGILEVSAPEGCNARILDDLVLDPQGQTILVSVKGRVHHAVLSEAIYLGEEGFVRSRPIWEASYLENCALRLQATLSDAAPNIMITYEDGDGEKSFLLAQSGRDGSYFLMEP